MSENENTTLSASPKELKPVETDDFDRFSQPEGRIDGFFTEQQSNDIRKRQLARARVFGIILALLAVLFFAITIAKVTD